MLVAAACARRALTRMRDHVLYKMKATALNKLPLAIWQYHVAGNYLTLNETQSVMPLLIRGFKVDFHAYHLRDHRSGHFDWPSEFLNNGNWPGALNRKWWAWGLDDSISDTRDKYVNWHKNLLERITELSSKVYMVYRPVQLLYCDWNRKSPDVAVEGTLPDGTDPDHYSEVAVKNWLCDANGKCTAVVFIFYEIPVEFACFTAFSERVLKIHV